MSICAFNMQTTPDMKGSSAGGAVLKFPVKQVNPYDQTRSIPYFCRFFLLFFLCFIFFGFPLPDAHKISAKLNYKYGQKVDDKVARRQRVWASIMIHGHVWTPHTHPLPALVKARQRISLAFGRSACQIGEASHSIL